MVGVVQAGVLGAGLDVMDGPAFLGAGLGAAFPAPLGEQLLPRDRESFLRELDRPLMAANDVPDLRGVGHR